jgi:hypothetical protein
LGIITILVLVGLLLAIRESNDGSSKTTKVSISASKACDILTASIAKQVIGDDAVNNTRVSSQASQDNFSTCNYITATKTVSLLIHGSTAGSTDLNQAEFNGDKPASALTVYGYGNAAFWDPRFHEFNILQNDTWYILAAGPSQPQNRTLDQAEQFAKLIDNKL